MNGDTAVLPAIAGVLRRRWWLLVCYLVLGGLLGAGAAFAFAPGFRSSGTVLLQGPLSDGELRTQALIATSSVVLDRTAAAFDRVRAQQLRGRVSAEVLDGNVIRISVSAPTARRAQRLTERVMDEYVAFSAELVRQARGGLGQLLRNISEQLDRIGSRLGDLSSGGRGVPGSVLAQLRNTLAETATTVDEITGNAGGVAFGTAGVVVLEPAGLPSERSAPTRAQLTVGSALVFLLVGTFAHVLAERANRRPHGAGEIAAALNSTVLGSVDVPTPGNARESGRIPRIRRGTARRWPFSSNGGSVRVSSGHDRAVRYRRVLGRLRGEGNRSLRVLVVVPEGDAAAHRLVAQLAVEAGRGGAPATVVTDDTRFSGLVGEELRDGHPDGVRLTIVPSSDPLPGGRRTVLEIVPYGPERATVPENSRARGVLVVFTAGTRTAWELVGISEACADAGHEVMGILLARPFSGRAAPGGSGPDGPAQAASMNGSVKAATS